MCKYIYIYINCHPQTDLFRSIRTHQHHLASVCGGARGVTVIVAGCGHDDTSSNPGRA